MARSEAEPFVWAGVVRSGRADAEVVGRWRRVRASERQLTKDLRAQVTALERDLVARAQDVPEFADALTAEYDGPARRSAPRWGSPSGARAGSRRRQPRGCWRRCSSASARTTGSSGRVPRRPGRAAAGGRGTPRAVLPRAPHPQRPRLAARRDRPPHRRAPDRGRPVRPAPQPAVGPHAHRSRRPPRSSRSGGAGTTAARSLYDFDGWDTRFLGDLYQDLSEAARKTYALLQTPEFVEEFILDLTLEPAIEEFGLEGLRTIDPACGSGHFLLGLFGRLFAKWRRREPGTDEWELISRGAGIGARVRQEPVRDVHRPLPVAGRGDAGGGGAEAGPGAGVPDQRGRGGLAAARARAYSGDQDDALRGGRGAHLRHRGRGGVRGEWTCSGGGRTTWWWATRPTSR